MNRFFTLITVFFLSISSVFCQSDYLVTEINSQSYFLGDLTNQDTIVYTYDSEDRRATSKSLTRLTQYSYDGNTTTRDVLSLPEMQFLNRVVQVSNDDGFPIVYSSFSGSNDNLYKTNVDSITRNADNLIVKGISYYDYGYGLEISNKRSYSYTGDGNVLSDQSIYYSDGEIYSKIDIFTTYDSDGYRAMLVNITEEPIIGAEYSDTTNFFYVDGELQSSVLKNYSSDGFRYCEKEEYESENMSETVYTSQATDINCSEYSPTELREVLLNDNLLNGTEYAVNYEFDGFGNQYIYSEFNYSQNGVIGDDEISISSTSVYYDYEMENYRFERNTFYKKSGIVSNSDIPLSDELVILGNVVDKNSAVSFEANDIEFNSFTIVNMSGHTIQHEPIIDKRNLFFNSPRISGMYFVQLFNGDKPVTKLKKLIVK